MYKSIKRSRNNESGFTLIELLIVIVILGVLSAVVVFSVGGINNTSKASACKADISSINTAAEAYYAQNSTPAASLGALVTAGFLHATAEIATPAGIALIHPNSYTVNFTPGIAPTATTAGTAGSASSTFCP